MGAFSNVVEGLLRKASRELPALAEKVSDRWIKRGASSVRELGPEGEMIVEGLHNFSEKHRMLFGEYTAARKKIFDQIQKPKDILDDYEAYFTKKKQAPTDLQQLVDFDRATNIAAYRKAAGSGIKVGPLNPDDWSRIWPRGFFEGANRQSAIDHLVKSGQTRNEAEADKLLSFLAGRSKGAKSHLLTSPRGVDLPGYRTDIVAPMDAMDQKLKHVAMHETFGDKAEVLSELLSQIRQKRGYAAYQTADKYVDVFLKKRGANYHPYSSVESGVNTLLAARMLGLTPIKHPSKIVNAVIKGGIGPSVKALDRMITDYGSAEEFALRSGAALSRTMDTVRTMFDQELGGGASWLPQLRLINMEERIGRTFAANIGREVALDSFAEFSETKSLRAKNKLLQLGIDAERALEKGLSEQDLLRAGLRTSDITQFFYNVEQLPIAWREHPLSRMMTLYKSFIYLQSQFLKNEVIKPAILYARTEGSQGEITPLVYFSILAPTVGEIIGDLYHLATRGNLSERPDPKFWLDRIVENLSYVGGFGILHDLVFSMSNRGRAVIPPLLSEIQELLSIPLAKHPGREALRQVPIVGQYARRAATPKRLRKKGFLERGELTRGLYRVLGTTQ